MDVESVRRHGPMEHAIDSIPVKEEAPSQASQFSNLDCLNPSTRSRYSSPSDDPPPPPPAAYATPPDEINGSSQDHTRDHWQRPETYVDDPIPPPPAKYSYPLPSISEALKVREAEQPAAQPVENVRPYRRYSNDTQSSDRYTQSREYQAERAAMQTPYTGAATQATAPSPASYRRSTNPSDSQHLYRAREPPDPAPSAVAPTPPVAYEQQWRPGFRAPPREDAYYPNSTVERAYPRQTHHSREDMPPPPHPTGSTIYTPSLSNPHTPSTALSGNAGYASFKPSGFREEDGKRSMKPIYGDSIKRHLDTFDLENALNTMSESSRELKDFSDFYRQKAHNTSRSGPLPGSTPHVQQIDDMMKHGSRIQQSLNSLREIVTAQQAEIAQQTREKEAKRIAAELSEQEAEMSGGGGFAGSDPKKRRGRAAPPGKCHSCNRVDTPEWRRGPDGARTLCNACGLHYAKLTRKTGSKSSQGGSDPRPKADNEMT